MRALAWPGMLAAGALIGAAAVVGWSGRAPVVALTPDVPDGVVSTLRSEGFLVQTTFDPANAVASGEAPRALGREADGWVLWTTLEDRAGLQVEAATRDAIGAPWALRVAAPPTRPAAGDRASAGLAALLGVLFTLYGVVIGAGTLMRDREDGALEADLSLPVPFWIHGAARALAGGATLAVGLGSTLLLLHGLIGIPQVGTWACAGASAGASGVALGLGAMAGTPGGFSGALSRALSATLGLAVLGWFVPRLGAWLPIASLAALFRGEGGLAMGLCVAGLTVAMGTTAVARFAHGEIR